MTYNFHLFCIIFAFLSGNYCAWKFPRLVSTSFHLAKTIQPFPDVAGSLPVREHFLYASPNSQKNSVVDNFVKELFKVNSYSEGELKRLNIRLSSLVSTLPEKETIFLLQSINETSKAEKSGNLFRPDLHTMTSLMNRLQS